MNSNKFSNYDLWAIQGVVERNNDCVFGKVALRIFESKRIQFLNFLRMFMLCKHFNGNFIIEKKYYNEMEIFNNRS
ncbi:MAG: hypothetical protein HOO91_01295 [Bacteroidales bacterium]|nr:hypothetical protein [Bacteroidales bacterium]